MDLLAILFRWMHIVFGIMWVGLAYWFNFIYVPFMGALDQGTRMKVLPQLAPRAFAFFRLSAMFTWISGILLLMLVFYHAQQIFPSQDQTWTVGGWVMVAVTFLMFFVYDNIEKSPIGKKPLALVAAAFVIVGLVAYAMYAWAGFGYRAYMIHIGAMFGTIMVMDGAMRLFPAQKKMFAALKAGTAPDPALMEMISRRSRNAVYLSVPLVFTMINMHTVVIGEENWWAILVVMAVAWPFVAWVYRISASLKGL